MRRRLFPILCASSLVLVLLVLWLWVRSYFHADYLVFGTAGGTTYVYAEACAVQVTYTAVPHLHYDLQCGYVIAPAAFLRPTAASEPVGKAPLR